MDSLISLAKCRLTVRAFLCEYGLKGEFLTAYRSDAIILRYGMNRDAAGGFKLSFCPLEKVLTTWQERSQAGKPYWNTQDQLSFWEEHPGSNTSDRTSHPLPLYHPEFLYLLHQADLWLKMTQQIPILYAELKTETQRFLLDTMQKRLKSCLIEEHEDICLMQDIPTVQQVREAWSMRPV